MYRRRKLRPGQQKLRKAAKNDGKDKEETFLEEGMGRVSCREIGRAHV